MSIQVFLDLIPEFDRYDESAICRIECSAKELRAMGAEVKALKAEASEQPASKGHEWMSRNVNDFASHFLQRYEVTGSLRESMMWAYMQTYQSAPADAVSAKQAANWPDREQPFIPPEIFEVSVGKEKRFAESLEKRLAIATAALESVAVDSQERFIRGVARAALAQIEEKP